MEDPVVCADGHSYERVFVERWLAIGRDTSPKTNVRLPFTTLIPNITLRNVIQSLMVRMPELQHQQLQQLRERVDVDAILAAVGEDQGKQLRGVAPPGPSAQELGQDSEDQRAIWHALGLLAHGSPAAQEEAAGRLRRLAKGNRESRQAICQGAGAVEGLVGLLACGSSRAQEEAEGALRLLAFDSENRWTSCQAAGAMERLVGLFARGSSRAQQEAEGAPRLLAFDSENRWAICQAAGAMEGLVGLLAHGSSRAQEEAAWALGVRVADIGEISQAISQAGGTVEGLVRLLSQGNSLWAPHLQERAASALGWLAFNNRQKQRAICQAAGAVEGLVGLLAPGKSRVPVDEATWALSVLAHDNSENSRAIGQAAGAVEALVALLASGRIGYAAEYAALALCCLARLPENLPSIRGAGAEGPAERLARDEGNPRAARHAKLLLERLRALEPKGKGKGRDVGAKGKGKKKSSMSDCWDNSPPSKGRGKPHSSAGRHGSYPERQSGSYSSYGSYKTYSYAQQR